MYRTILSLFAVLFACLFGLRDPFAPHPSPTVVNVSVPVDRDQLVEPTACVAGERAPIVRHFRRGPGSYSSTC